MRKTHCLIASALWSLAVIAGLVGCQPHQPTTTTAPSEASPAAVVSDVPLRVWVAAPLSDPHMLIRQWLANSEQPLEFRSLTVAELLAESRCNCDLLIYPANLIGELTTRNWIVKLQAPSAELSTENSDDAATLGGVPSGDLPSQSTYASRAMGISLGNAIPAFIVSNPFPDPQLQAATWSEVLQALQVSETEEPALSFDEQAIDHDAVVDRFLAIAATVSKRDPSYGLLFDLQTMRSRLGEPEYLRAAAILGGIATQVDGQRAVLGTHSEAWAWAADHAQPALAIAAPALIDSSSTALTSGKILSFRNSQTADSATLTAASEPTDRLARPSVVAWSTGRGLIASVSANCRQTNQANLLLRWLAGNNARASLSSLVAGVESTTPAAGPEALSWRARSALAEVIGKGVGLSHEPRLPRAIDYRRALADQLVQFLSGKKSAQQALQDADRNWNALTDSVGKAQRLHYEQSLNLGL